MRQSQSARLAQIRAARAAGRRSASRLARLGVRPHRRLRNSGTDYVSESGMKWMGGGAVSAERPEPEARRRVAMSGGTSARSQSTAASTRSLFAASHPEARAAWPRAVKSFPRAPVIFY